MPTKSTRATGTIIFVLAVLIGLGLAIAAIWGDYEAMSYYYNGASYEMFGGLQCPVLMSPSEVATVSARFDNPDSEEINPYYRLRVDGLTATRNIEAQIQVPAHGSATAQWTVDSNDVNLGFFVLIRLNVLPVARFSTREATCGVMVVNVLGLRGGPLLGLALSASLLGIVVGLGLRERGSGVLRPREVSARNGLRAAGVTALLAMLAGLMSWWLIGLLFCAVTILLLVIMLSYAGS
jgi:hypothetical protein